MNMLSYEEFKKVISGPITNFMLGAVWATFVLNSISGYIFTGQTILLAFCAFETLTLVFFLLRTRAFRTSLAVSDWIIALVGTFTGLLFIPGVPTAFWYAGSILFWIGVAGEILSLSSLNRSFAIVPSLRAIKTGGMYRLVRHPLYASHLLTYFGYVLQSFSVWNAVIFLVVFSFLLLRIRNEEHYLASEDAYRAYQKSVRWRLIPFVF